MHMITLIFCLLLFGQITSKSLNPVNDDNSVQGRTLMAVSIFMWMLNVMKAMVKPFRSMYIRGQPEIRLTRCLMEPYFDTENMDERREKRDTITFKPIQKNKPKTENGLIPMIKSMYNTWNEMMNNLRQMEGMGCVMDYSKTRFFIWLDH